MWKESYRLGVDLIDRQHKELFEMVGNLLDVVQNGKGDKKKECADAIEYMKHYTIQHFKDEEEYQRQIKYDGFREHKMIHDNFTREVLVYEKKMIASDFCQKDVKDFLGMLIAWLVYHVAGADQQIVSARAQTAKSSVKTPIDSYFHISTCDILNKLTGMELKDIKVVNKAAGNLQSTIAVKVDMSGDVSGAVTYKYTKNLAFDLIQSMASFSPRAIDEMVCSAMVEISNIISIRAVGLMSAYGFSCNLDFPVMQVQPAFLPSNESIIFDTGMGILEMEIALK